MIKPLLMLLWMLQGITPVGSPVSGLSLQHMVRIHDAF